MRSLRQRPSMWGNIKEWDARARTSSAPFRLMDGAWLVHDREQIHDVLTHTERYVEQSAFLRTQTLFPLPLDARKEILGFLVPRMAELDLSWDNVKSTTLPARSGIRRSHRWGVRLIRDLSRPVLVDADYGTTYSLMNYYIERKSIRDDNWGAYNRLDGARRSELHQSLGKALRVESRTRGSARNDLATFLGTQFSLDLPDGELGELFSKLTQSVVGFTGSLIEYATLLGSRNPDIAHRYANGEGQNDVHETLRLHPISWRLARVAAYEHVLGEVVIREGDSVVLSTATLHRSDRHWRNPLVYDPARWSEDGSTRSGSYLPFGKGRGMCPGRSAALVTANYALQQIFTRYDARVWTGPLARPYVRSLLTVPTSHFYFRPKSRVSMPLAKQ